MLANKQSFVKMQAQFDKKLKKVGVITTEEEGVYV